MLNGNEMAIQGKNATVKKVQVLEKASDVKPSDDDKKPTTTTKNEAAAAVPNIRPAAPEAAPAETDANGNVVTSEAPATTDGGNGGSTNEGDKNQNTGVVLAVIPAVMAAAGVMISKKRK